MRQEPDIAVKIKNFARDEYEAGRRVIRVYLHDDDRDKMGEYYGPNTVHLSAPSEGGQVISTLVTAFGEIEIVRRENMSPFIIFSADTEPLYIFERKGNEHGNKPKDTVLPGQTTAGQERTEHDREANTKG